MRKTIVLGGLLILLQLPLLALVLLQERTWGGREETVRGRGRRRRWQRLRDRRDAKFRGRWRRRVSPEIQATSRLLWRRTYGTAPDPENSGAEAGIDVAVAPDNGIVVLGNYRDGNIFLAKFNGDGELVWDLTWGTTRKARVRLTSPRTEPSMSRGSPLALTSRKATPFC